LELRHLRYFTAVVQWKEYREASRRLHLAQPALSRAIADLEDALGVKLFSRAKRMAQLEGDAFYDEAVRTLAQAEAAVNTARRAGAAGRCSSALARNDLSYSRHFMSFRITDHQWPRSCIAFPTP
jgi:DNA-binding transcriptional LysR family regulator